MRILITGATGFVGSHLIEELIKTDYTLLALGRQEKNIIPNIDYVFLDLRDIEKTEQVISKFKPEIVYHLAANCVESSGEHSPIDMITNGYNTFFNVLASSIRAGSLKKFIYTSSAAVYGNIRTPYTEEQQPKPNDIYAVTKYANELALQIMANHYNFSYVIVRPHNITGERQEYTNPSRNVVVLFMQLLRMGKTPKILGTGENVRCFTYVKDVAKVLTECINLENVVLNAGSSKATSINELYQEIVKVSKIKTEPEYGEAREHDVLINTVAHEAAKKLIPDYKETSFEETISKTWVWLSRQPLIPFKFIDKEIDL